MTRKRKKVFRKKGWLYGLAMICLSLLVVLTNIIPTLALEEGEVETSGIEVTTNSSNRSLKTFGFDYGHNHLTGASGDAEIKWLAEHRDIIIGLYNEGMPEDVYDKFKAINPDIKFYAYFAYNTVSPASATFMEKWCVDNGYDPEDLYYHFEEDTYVTSRSYDSATGKFKQVFVPGYGPKGSATTLKEARVPSAWNNCTMHNINPTSQVFREASQAHMLWQLTVNENNGKYLDGFILDTFDGTVNSQFDIKLENTIELRSLGITTSSEAYTRVSQDILDMRDEQEKNLSASTGKNIRLAPNGADVSYIFDNYGDMYADRLGVNGYDEMIVEYLSSSGGVNKERISYLKDIYDSMENGNTWYMNSQTNVYQSMRPDNVNNPTTDDSEWHGFLQHILAVQYLVNHDNAYFAINQGSAVNYGTIDKTFSKNHWYPNYDYPIGNPVVRSGKDYWGDENTNRFFLYETHPDPTQPNNRQYDYEVMGREYDNALVLANFCQRTNAGIAKLGQNRVPIQLDGKYRRLLEDNTLGPVITEIELGTGEGAILIKEDKANLADYSKVDTAISKIPNDLTLYTEATAQAVTDAKDAVIRGKDKSEQTIVDAYSTAIEDAINNLVYKDADYTKVDQAIANIPSDLSLYTDTSVQAVIDAQSAVIRGKLKTEQAVVDGYATSIQTAINNLIYKDADYTRVTTAINSIPSDLSIYTDGSVQAVIDAKNAVVYGKNISEQTTVDSYAKAIEDAVNALTVKGPVVYADYTKVDQAIANIPVNLGLYTDSSVQMLINAQSAVVRGKESNEQATVDAYATAINNAISNLVYKDADYTKVDVAISKIPNDLSLYTDASVRILQDAQTAVIRGKNISEQTTVNGYAKAIEDAVAQLTYKNADYTNVNNSISNVPKDLSNYTEESVKVLNDAIAAVEYDKKINEQSIVDDYATAIDNAIKGLKLKDKKPASNNNGSNNSLSPDADNLNKTEHTNTSLSNSSIAPKTGDTTHNNLYLLAMIASLGTLLILKKKLYK